MTLIPWTRGKAGTWDVTVVNPLAQSVTTSLQVQRLSRQEGGQVFQHAVQVYFPAGCIRVLGGY